MTNDSTLRQEVREPLNEVRRRILGFTGLYSDENLFRDVLQTCDEMAMQAGPDPRVDDAMRGVSDRCRRLAHVTNRFADRDPVVIAAARAQAIAAIDLLQDIVFELRKARAYASQSGGLLKRRSL